MKQRRLQKCQAYFAFFYSSPELGVPTSFADILYTAVFANEKTKHFSMDKLSAFKNIVSDFTDTDSDSNIFCYNQNVC